MIFEPPSATINYMKKQSEKFTREWFVEQGRIGGKKTKELYGTSHYAKIRKKDVDNLPKEDKKQ